MDTLLQQIPKDILNFLLVGLFSMLLGLEQRSHHEFGKGKSLLGTDRTFTLIGILGFILYLLDTERLMFFAGGGVVIGLYFGIFYTSKIWIDGQSGLTSILVGFITYCLAPLVYLQPPWLVLLILVTVLVLVEIKDSLIAISKKFDESEFLTLAKFLAIAGVVLPLTPDKIILPGLELTPYKFWLAVVAVSTISYVSYLLRKFVFPGSGLIVTGILGGLYSSTAATFTLAKKSNSSGYSPAATAGAIIFATAMMYFRILLLAFIFNKEVAMKLLIPLNLLAVCSLVAGWYLYRRNRKAEIITAAGQEEHHNPLEFRTAFLFAFLFVLFAVITHFVFQYYGNSGLQALSYFVGVTDIDPYLLNLFQEKQTIASSVIVMATIQATLSNNILKMIYGVVMGSPSMRRHLVQGFSAIIVVSILLLIILAV